MSQEVDGYSRLLIQRLMLPWLRIIENYCIVATTALLWFDFSLTFTTEVRRIWRRKFSGATLVFLFMRYSALLDRVLFVLEVLLWKSSDRTCYMIERADDVLVVVNYLSFTAFTILRVYGVWGRDWKPLLLVVPLALVKPILYAAGPPFGCVLSYDISDHTLATFSVIVKVTTIAADAILIVLTWIKTFGINKDSVKLGMKTPLASLLLRDGRCNVLMFVWFGPGTAYFIILLLIQIVTIITSQIGSSLTVWLVWPYFDQVLTVIFLSRFMLDLRGLYFADRSDTQQGEGSFSLPGFSDIRFTTSIIVGNLGAPLSNANGSSTADTHSISSPTRGPRDVEDSAGSTGEGAVPEEEKFGAEWYEDEKPEYSWDPFKEGMRPRLP
ncbi:hypothetical protein C8Q80DRAFT_1118138 [Daedaleopsis nitida]|nr:hypothetical protein C8Q80DRAFT_1118138 [Daedaleopsis nitida]